MEEVGWAALAGKWPADAPGRSGSGFGSIVEMRPHHQWRRLARALALSKKRGRARDSCAPRSRRSAGFSARFRLVHRRACASLATDARVGHYRRRHRREGNPYRQSVTESGTHSRFEQAEEDIGPSGFRRGFVPAWQVSAHRSTCVPSGRILPAGHACAGGPPDRRSTDLPPFGVKDRRFTLLLSRVAAAPRGDGSVYEQLSTVPTICEKHAAEGGREIRRLGHVEMTEKFGPVSEQPGSAVARRTTPRHGEAIGGRPSRWAHRPCSLPGEPITKVPGRPPAHSRAFTSSRIGVGSCGFAGVGPVPRQPLKERGLAVGDEHE